MVLLFLLLFAILAYAILVETDDAAEPASGTGACPGCARRVEEDWLLCPRCRTLLKTGCAGCGHRIDSWRPFCPWCGRRGEEASA
jgi:RNA polymerase subunit RPABC4/transcription elongation factor Spt4